MNSTIKNKIDTYPNHIKPIILTLRNFILETAKEQNISDIDETLKWNELSYSVKTGTPVRIDWKEKTPNKYFIFFNCQTKLIETFRKVYFNILEFEGNRAIVLDIDKEIPSDIIKHCIEVAFNYKKLKDLPLLGI